MPDDGGLAPPLVFAVAAGLAAGALRTILDLAGRGSHPGAGGALLALLLTPAFVAIGSFIVGGMLYLIWQAMGSKESFETSYRCAAYVAGIAPFALLLERIPYAGGILALAWGCGLLVIASERVHGIARTRALAVFGGVFAALALMSVVSEYHARHFVYPFGHWHVHVGADD